MSTDNTKDKSLHDPTRNGHCSGCTDPRSEGTHQMGTFEHPDEAQQEANDISAAYVQQPKLSERLRELHKTLLLEVYPDWVTDELDHCATEAEALEAQEAGMTDAQPPQP